MPLLKFHISRKSNRSKLDTRGTGNTTLDIQATAAHGRPNSAPDGPCMLECVALVRFARGCAQRARFFLRAHANETNAQAAGDTPMQQTNAQAAGDTRNMAKTPLPRPARKKMAALHPTFAITDAGSGGASAASGMQVRLLV